MKSLSEQADPVASNAEATILARLWNAGQELTLCAALRWCNDVIVVRLDVALARRKVMREELVVDHELPGAGLPVPRSVVLVSTVACCASNPMIAT